MNRNRVVITHKESVQVYPSFAEPRDGAGLAAPDDRANAVIGRVMVRTDRKPGATKRQGC